ncbi:predicted protein, partial [Nematostella vectensis]
FKVYFTFFSLMIDVSSATIDFVGDISFDGIQKIFNNMGMCSYNDSLRSVAPILRQSDLAVGNLESPYGTKNMRKNHFWGKPRLMADAESVSALRFAGFDILGLANNHQNDYGEESLNYTISTLRRTGLKWFGVNYGKADDPQRPLIVKVKGRKVGFLGYCNVIHNDMSANSHFDTCRRRRGSLLAGPAIYSPQSASRDINRLKDKVDVIIVAMHWGAEGSLKPNSNQTKINSYLLSLGVQLVIGSHPHVLQPHQMTGNTLTAFSLGNFLFGPCTGFPLKGFYYDRKPSKFLIKKLIQHTMRGRDPSLFSRILRITINKCVVQKAEYLPLQTKYNFKTGCLLPEQYPRQTWIEVCGRNDIHC